MDILPMEGLLDFGDLWDPGHTYDVHHFDDLGVNVKNTSFDIKPQPLEDSPKENVFQEFLESPAEGVLGIGDDWMNQPCWMEFMVADDEPTNSSSSSEPISTLATQSDLSTIEASSICESPVHSPPPSEDRPCKAISLLEGLLTKSEECAIDLPIGYPDSQVISEIRLENCETSTVELEDILDVKNIQFIQEPFSPDDDIESIISSASSPASSQDTSSDTSLICNSSDLYKIVSVPKRTKVSPYSRSQSKSSGSRTKGRKQSATLTSYPSDVEIELMSKKDRKKLQNKNAAIRYRQKKKLESVCKNDEVEDLEKINTDLNDKVLQLQREITYMKDLINEVRQARGLPKIIE